MNQVAQTRDYQVGVVGFGPVGAMVANMAVLMLHQERAWEAAQSLAMTDALTGLMNIE